MTRAKRERNAKNNAKNAKNNARIMRNNAGVCDPRVESGAAYTLYLRELRPAQGPEPEKQRPVLVNKLIGVGQPIPGAAAF
jgi:hypothetical protein